MREETKVIVTEAGNAAVAGGKTTLPAREAVTQVVSGWQGVSMHAHRFGGVEFRLGRRELGHLHATFADLPFPVATRNDLIAAGRAMPHHILPESGWVTAPMRSSADVETVIELFRQNYERAMKSHG